MIQTLRKEKIANKYCPIYPDVEIYTDGSTFRKTGIGAYGFIVVANGELIHREVKAIELQTEAKGFKETQNIGYLEMMGLKSALSYCNSEIPCLKVAIFSDSSYIVNSYNKWSINWAKYNSWTKFQKDWKWINNNRSDNVYLSWVKSHSGNKWNDMIDELVRESFQNMYNETIQEQEEIPA